MDKKILLVEDNPVNRRLAGFLLRSQGYEVVEATSAAEALQILAKDQPDLIVMDIQLPEMDGLEATTKLKAEPATAKIPVIAVTSYAMAGDRGGRSPPVAVDTLPNLSTKPYFSQRSVVILNKRTRCGSYALRLERAC